MPAQKTIHEVFEECDRKWRGIGTIPMSGWRLRTEFDGFNAERKFDVGEIRAEEFAALHCRADPARALEAP